MLSFSPGMPAVKLLSSCDQLTDRKQARCMLLQSKTIKGRLKTLCYVLIGCGHTAKASAAFTPTLSPVYVLP